MSRPTRGMVLGKFLPPHLGHKYLIDFAAGLVDELSVLVCTTKRQPIPGPLRYEWMRRSFGGVRVIHCTDENPDAPEDAETPEQFWEMWRTSILSYLGTPPDVVFASEPYGAKLAEVLGAQFIPGDYVREMVPVSGTAIRNHPARHWEFLIPAARPYFVRRVAVIGPESSGKSTLTKSLAARYDTKYASEYARTYLDATNLKITPEAILAISRGHRASEDALAEQCRASLLFCDTEALTTTFWSRYSQEDVPPEVERHAAEDRYALYLVTTATEEWAADPQRFTPDFAARAEFSRECVRELMRQDRRFVVLNGTWGQRSEQAAAAVDDLLAESQ